VDEQLIFQLDNIQLFLNIYQQEHILKIKIFNTCIFILIHLRNVFCLIFNSIVICNHFFSWDLNFLSNFFIFNHRLFIGNILYSTFSFYCWLSSSNWLSYNRLCHIWLCDLRLLNYCLWNNSLCIDWLLNNRLLYNRWLV
jgi:hypothetical protein